MTDPYELLEVTKDATPEAIKKSYRRLAKKYHPDFNPGNKEAEKKFKSIQHAFDQVGTAEARVKWDRGETDEQKQREYEEFSRGQHAGGGQPFYYNSQDQGGRYSYSFGEDLGGEDIFEGLFGFKGRGAGRDETYQVEVDFREAALGAEKIITLPGGKDLKVKIPAGIEGGKKLRFKGMGRAGDVYMEIKVRPLAGFRREGRDLVTELNVSFFEALLGSDVRVPTLDGSVVLRVPAGVSTGSKLRIRGKGVGSGEERGNQLVVLRVVMPKEVDPALKESVTELKERFDYNPRGLNEEKEHGRSV